MSFFVISEKFSVEKANKTIKQLGYGDITALDELEVRLKKSGSKFTLVIKENGVEKEIGNSASESLALLLTVDGTGSLLDADFLRGKKFDSGRNNALTGGKLVTFSEAFSSAPNIGLCPEAGNTCWGENFTTTGFKLKSTAATAVRWIAYGG
ncbi:MAG: hypothetical protein PVH61_13825 [Candidatus Aminicenantes bacterium]|jgi:hypothetical protein